jgi:hypothetical protein
VGAALGTGVEEERGNGGKEERRGDGEIQKLTWTACVHPCTSLLLSNSIFIIVVRGGGF